MNKLTSSLALLFLGAAVSLPAQAEANEDSDSSSADVTAVSTVDANAVLPEVTSATAPAATETPMSAVSAALGSVPTWVPVAAGVVGVIAIASSGGGSSSSSGATGTN